VEVLLKYGADPSVPNNSGLVPVEMSDNPYVRELFMRDKENIFSPMVQARQLFQDYLITSNQSTQSQGQLLESRKENDDHHEGSPVNNLTEAFTNSLMMNSPEPRQDELPEEQSQSLLPR
jgi:hypothetical protein